MTEQQLQLVDVAPSLKLPDRQQAVLDALRQAGHDGITADEAGALAHEYKQTRWRHDRTDRCEWCGRDGQQILRRLDELGLARYRRKTKNLDGAWLATGLQEPKRVTAALPTGMTDVIPY